MQLRLLKAMTTPHTKIERLAKNKTLTIVRVFLFRTLKYVLVI